MSTRSIVARPTDNGFVGVYVHSDGYPTAMAKHLHGYVNRWGAEKVRDLVTTHEPGWSSLWPYPADDLPDYMQRDRDGMEQVVLDDTVIGERYTTGGMVFTSKEDRGWTEWTYVLGDRAIAVMQDEGEEGKPNWVLRGHLNYRDEATDEALTLIECGAQYERCGHYASAHLPEEQKQAAGRLGMGQWLGTEPMRFSDAVAVMYFGERLPLSGSGGTGSAQTPRAWVDRAWADNPRSVRYWWSSAGSIDVRTARITKAGYKTEVPLVMPATSVAPEHVVEPGTVLPR